MSSFDTGYNRGGPRPSAASSEHQQSGNINKKKFGKNLNKLTKPPPPPPNVSLNSSRRDSFGNGSSSQGLLLLSTKRGSTSSTTAGGSSATPSSNLLSKLSGGTASASASLAGPRPFNTPSLRNSAAVGGDNGNNSANATSGWKTPSAAATGAIPNSETSGAPWKLGGETNAASVPSMSSPSATVLSSKQPSSASVQELTGGSQAPNVVSRPTVATGDECGNFTNNAAKSTPQDPYSQSEPSQFVDVSGSDSNNRSGNVTIAKHESYSSSSGMEPNTAHSSQARSETLADAHGDDEPRMSTAERIRARRRLKDLEEKKLIAPPLSTSSLTNGAGGSGRAGKKANSSTPQPTTVPAPIPSPHTGGSSSAKKKEVNIILEPLNRPKVGGDGRRDTSNSGDSREDTGRVASSSSAGAESEKTSPSRTYSSLLGGSSTSNKQFTGDPADRQERWSAQNEESILGSASAHQQIRSFPTARTSGTTPQLYNPYASLDTKSMKSMATETGLPLQQPAVAASPVAMIHLTSYDDQDRGERNRTSSGPRMLFDPKSGSMVEARPRESRRARGNVVEDEKGRGDGGATGKGRGKVERKSKSSSRDGSNNEAETEKPHGQGKGRKDPSACVPKRFDSFNESVTEQISVNEVDGKSGSRKQLRKKGSREKPCGLSDTKRADKGDRSFRTSDPVKDPVVSEKALATSSPSSNKRGLSDQKQAANNSRLPRTVGGLYKKDEKISNAVLCGSDEDQGWVGGGGKVGNTSSYPKHLERQMGQQYGQSADKAPGDKGMKRMGAKKGETSAPQASEYNEISRGKRRNEVNRKDRRHVGPRNIASSEGLKLPTDASAELPDLHFDDDFNVDDNLFSLLEDGPESPTLKATADAWRPSEAALRAAAAAAKSDAAVVDTKEGGVIRTAVAEDDDSESDAPFLGLGFDPTLNMDSVMMSPSLRSEVNDEDAMGLSSLSLGPANGPSSNPFSSLSSRNQFLGSTTWGGGSLNANPGASLGLDWDSLLGADGSEPKTPSQNVDDSTLLKKSGSSPFLSLSPLVSNADGKNTWGSGTFGAKLGSLRSSVLGGFGKVEKD